MATTTQERNVGTPVWRDDYDKGMQLYEVDGRLMTEAEVARNGLGHTVRLASSGMPVTPMAPHAIDSRVEAAAEIDTFNVIG